MAYGKATVIEDPAEKIRAMDSFIDRYFLNRSKLIRPATDKEIKATTFLGMAIESASGKIRNEPIHDDEEDYAVPAWTALIPIRTTIGAAEECPRQLEGVTRPDDMSSYGAGRNLDEVLLESYRKLYGNAD